MYINIDNYSMIVLPCVTAENEASLLQAETQSSLQKLLVARSIAVVLDPASVSCIFEKEAIYEEPYTCIYSLTYNYLQVI